jgi:hypothetical protein
MNIEDSNIERAAYVWWLSHRPTGYTEEQHLKNPTINMAGGLADKDLARAVAAKIARNIKEEIHPWYSDRQPSTDN